MLVTVIDLVEEDGFRLLQGEDLNKVVESLNTNCLNMRIHTNGGDATLFPSDHTLLINKTNPSATNVFLPDLITLVQNQPLSLYPGRRFQVKDKKGDAAENNITIVPPPNLLIDGAATFTMVFPYESIDILFDGTGYSIL